MGVSYRGNFKNQLEMKSNRFNADNRDSILDVTKNGVAHEVPVSMNLKVMKNFTLTPSVNYREIWQFDYVEKAYSSEDSAVTETIIPHFTRGNSYNGGMSLTTKLYGNDAI